MQSPTGKQRQYGNINTHIVTAGLDRYVRLEIRSEGGTTYTQLFGLEKVTGEQ